MAERIENVEELSPYKLLSNFYDSRLMSCMFAAVLVHVLIIGGLSTNYIIQELTDTPAVVEDDRDAVPENAQNGPPNSESPNEITPPQVENSEDTTAVDEERPPVVDRVTDKPDPMEIPEEPGGLGLPIDGFDEN